MTKKWKWQSRKRATENKSFFFLKNLLKESKRYYEKGGESISIGTQVADSKISGGPGFLYEIFRRVKRKKRKKKVSLKKSFDYVGPGTFDYVGPGKKLLSRPNLAVSNKGSRKENRKGESISSKQKNESSGPIASSLVPISQFLLHENSTRGISWELQGLQVEGSELPRILNSQVVSKHQRGGDLLWKAIGNMGVVSSHNIFCS